MSETLEIPGRGKRCSALRSLLQLRAFRKELGTWARKREAEHGAPVFFAHLGMPSIVIADAVSAGFVYAAPKDLCDRLDRVGFGPSALRPRIIGPIRPALVTHGELNVAKRRLIDSVLDGARGRFDSSLETAFGEIIADWTSRDRIPLQEVTGVGGKISARWLLGVDVDAQDAGRWPVSSFSPITTSWLLNQVLSLVARPSRDDRDRSDRILEAARRSPYLDEVHRIGRETGMSAEEALWQVIFLAIFNSKAIGLLTAAALAQLSLAPRWAEAIRDELGGTELKPADMDRFGILHKVYLECGRLFSAPKILYREALRDFDLPCGDGHTYRILNGDTLLLSMRSIHYDRRVFSSPNTFDPNRFDDPEVLRHLFLFGPHDKPYRCAGDDQGYSAVFSKYVLARLLQGSDWEVAPRPTVSADADFSPEDTALVSFRPRA